MVRLFAFAAACIAIFGTAAGYLVSAPSKADSEAERVCWNVQMDYGFDDGHSM